MNALTQSDQDSLNAAADGNLLNRTPQDALTIIENKLKVCTSRNKPIVSKVSTTTSSSSPSPDVTALSEIVKELVLLNKANQQASVKAVEETCGGPHLYYECIATDSNTFNASAATDTYNQGGPGYRPQGDPNYRASNQMGPPTFPPPNKAITNRSGVAYDGPTIPPTPSPLPKEVKHETEATKDKVQTTSSESTTHIQPLVVQVPILEPEVAPKPNPIPLHFDISFADALLHMAKFSSTFKSLLNECLALADLGAGINLMPLSVSKKLSLLELTPTRMTLELANRSVAIPLALIDVHGEGLTLRVNDEAITFKAGHTSRHSCNYYDETVHQVNVIDVACEEYAQEVLEFSDSSTSYNPTPSDPVIDSSSPSFTPFEGGDFILEEIETFLRTPDELSKLEDDYYDMEGDILYLEKLLNEDPSLNLPLMKNEDLKQVDVTMTKPSIKEPPELELKDLPSHLEYAFLKDTDKLPVIISK
ncbi:hypothetical protein Tco_0417890 [Tanacetum coccineum]